jgi:hypothetical protein
VTIGRVGRDITLGEVSEWAESGDGSVSVTGTTRGLGLVDASFLREQLLGLLDQRGERAVPCSFGFDDSRDGWYVVESVEVRDLMGPTQLRGEREWSATLRRLGYRVQPRYELHRFGSMWTNVHGITNASYAGWCALPADAEAVDLGSDETSWARSTRTSESGNVAFYAGGSQVLYDTVVSAYVPIDSAYAGAARVDMDVTGSGDWRTVVGADVRNLPADRWRLTNGLVRTYWSTGGGGLILDVYNGSAWEGVGTYSSTRTAFRLSQATGSTLTSAPVAIAVLRNDPTAASLRLLFDYEDKTSRIQWDLSVRRGERNIVNVVKSRSVERWGIAPSVSVSATYGLVVTTSASIRPTSNDDDGNRWVQTIPGAWVANLDDGTWRVNTSTTVVGFGLGAELNGSNATGQNAHGQTSYHFLVQATETLMIAGM